MGCLLLLILAFIFRGAILTALGAIVASFFAILALLVALLSVSFWGLVALVLLCAIVAAFA